VGEKVRGSPARAHRIEGGGCKGRRLEAAVKGDGEAKLVGEKCRRIAAGGGQRGALNYTPPLRADADGGAAVLLKEGGVLKGEAIFDHRRLVGGVNMFQIQSGPTMRGSFERKSIKKTKMSSTADITPISTSSLRYF
jgi:hypothetical protein